MFAMVSDDWYICMYQRLRVVIFSTPVLSYLTDVQHSLFNGPLSWTTQVSRYQKGKTNLDFTEARDSEWQWHRLGHMQVCNSLQTDNHASTPPLNFLQAGCPFCHPANSVKALKALRWHGTHCQNAYVTLCSAPVFLAVYSICSSSQSTNVTYLLISCCSSGGRIWAVPCCQCT